MSWMEIGINRQIGVCPMGTCPVPKDWADLMGDPVMLAVAIGPISQQQILEQASSQPNDLSVDFEGYLHRQLAETILTEVMYPERFIVVPNLPKTNNGKLDKRALLAITEKSDVSGKRSVIQPSTQLEKAIFEVWQEKGVLKDKVFGIYDSYQAAGGNSMTQNVLSLRLQEVFGVEISSSDVFINSTIAKQAQLIDVRQDEELKYNASFPLAFMVVKGNLEMIHKLLDARKVDVNQRDARGRTALYIAAYHGYGDIVTLLLQHNAQVDIAKHSGMTPEDCAIRRGHQHLVEQLTPARVFDVSGAKTFFTAKNKKVDPKQELCQLRFG